VLAAAITDTLAAVSGQARSVVIPTLHKDHPDLDALATTLARLHNHGHSPAWARLYPHAQVIPLPTYPFQHRTYWVSPAPPTDVAAAGLARPEHPLLGALTDLADQDQLVWTARLSLATHPWLGGHRVHERVVFAATGFIDVLLHAADQVGAPVIEELVLHTPLIVSEHPGTDLQLCVHDPDDTGGRAVTVHARPAGEHNTPWRLHASGVLGSHPHPPPRR
jgi:acyl transferase domain-containing protein